MLRAVLLYAVTWMAVSPALAAESRLLHRGIAHDAMFDVCFRGDAGIAVGDWGSVLRSTDGGQTWASAPSGAERALTAVSCERGPELIVGQRGLILRAEGEGFVPVDSGSQERLLAVAANTSGLAVAVGGFGTVLRSQDAGESWEALSFDWEAMLNDFMEPHLYDVSITESGSILMAGEFGLILRSDNGGDDWSVVNNGEASLFDLDMQGDLGFAVGQDSTVLMSNDAGMTWAPMDVPAEANLLSVWHRDNNILITGIRTVLKSNDSGSTWQLVDDLDFKVGWYQSASAPQTMPSIGPTAYLVGRGGNIVELPLN